MISNQIEFQFNRWVPLKYTDLKANQQNHIVLVLSLHLYYFLRSQLSIIPVFTTFNNEVHVRLTTRILL